MNKAGDHVHIISELNYEGNLDLSVLIEDLGKLGTGFSEPWA